MLSSLAVVSSSRHLERYASVFSAAGTREKRKDVISDPHVVYFSASIKPWQHSLVHPFKREYREYRRTTPWARYKEEKKWPRKRKLVKFFKQKLYNAFHALLWRPSNT